MTTNSSDLTEGFPRTQSHEMNERAHPANFERQPQESGSQIRSPRPLQSRLPETPRILIVTNDDTLASKLGSAFRETGFNADRVRSMTAACESARSGLFQVVVTQPELADGSWKRLADLASHYRPGFVVILVAKTFELRQRGQALEEGAFDVLDALSDLPSTCETARRALWAAYLTGAELSLEAANSLRSS